MTKRKEKLKLSYTLSQRLVVTGAAILLVAAAVLVKGKLFGDFVWHVGG